VIDFIYRWDVKGRPKLRHAPVADRGLDRHSPLEVLRHSTSWQACYGKVNKHVAWLPRDHWIEDWEREAIVKFVKQFPLESYRRLTFLMPDRDTAAVSLPTTYLVP
jgi:hypothetical protein